MKLCDMLILIGKLIVILSAEILFCGIAFIYWGVFVGVIMSIAAIGIDIAIIGYELIE